MNLNQRERKIGIFAGSAVAILLVYYAFVTPMLLATSDLRKSYDSLQLKEDQAANLLAGRKSVDARIAKIVKIGVATDASTAERQLDKALQAAASRTDLRIESKLFERDMNGNGTNELAFGIRGKGSAEGIGRFLAGLESADIPLRVREVEILAQTEGSNDLTLRVQLSTLYGSLSAKSNSPAPSNSGEPKP